MVWKWVLFTFSLVEFLFFSLHGTSETTEHHIRLYTHPFFDNNHYGHFLQCIVLALDPPPDSVDLVQRRGPPTGGRQLDTVP